MTCDPFCATSGLDSVGSPCTSGGGDDDGDGDGDAVFCFYGGVADWFCTDGTSCNNYVDGNGDACDISCATSGLDSVDAPCVANTSCSFFSNNDSSGWECPFNHTECVLEDGIATDAYGSEGCDLDCTSTGVDAMGNACVSSRRLAAVQDNKINFGQN